MAGSYQHVVKKDGSLRSSQRIQGMLECTSGDVAEAVEEMYGMIWYLADGLADAERLSGWSPTGTAADLVEDAEKNYVEGLRASPSIKGVLWRGE